MGGVTPPRKAVSFGIQSTEPSQPSSDSCSIRQQQHHALTQQLHGPLRSTATHPSSQRQLTVPKHHLHLDCSLFTLSFLHTPPSPPHVARCSHCPYSLHHAFPSLFCSTLRHNLGPGVSVCKCCITAYTHTCSLTNSSLNRKVFLPSPFLSQMGSLITQSRSASLAPLSAIKPWFLADRCLRLS